MRPCCDQTTFVFGMDDSVTDDAIGRDLDLTKTFAFHRLHREAPELSNVHPSYASRTSGFLRPQSGIGADHRILNPR